MKKKVFIFILALFSLRDLISAPVDYSEEMSEKKNRKRKARKQDPMSQFKTTGNSIKKRATGAWTFETALETIEVESTGESSKASLYKINVYYKPQGDFYLKVGYFLGSIDSSHLDAGFSKKGNLEMRVVANWLKWSNGQFQSKLDLFGGIVVGEKFSYFGSSRTDKIIGLETSRNFSNFILSLGHELRLTGSPKDPSEMAIGDIRKYYAILGWKITPDINFAVEAIQNNIRSSTGKSNGLEGNVSSGYLSPWLFLNISPRYDVTLGGVFRTNKVKNISALMKAKLWSFPGLYGNSIFAKINLNI